MPAPVSVINEGSTAYLTVSFLDRHGNAETPISISYRVDCRTTGQQMLGDTSVSPDDSVLLTIRPAANAINDDENEAERRVVTVTAVYAVDGSNNPTDADTREFEYEVRNLEFA